MKIQAIKQYIQETWAHRGFQKYFQNTSWMFIGQLSMIISFLINIWLARYFGAEKFGTINYVLAFVGIFSFIANFGIGDILIREIVKTPEKKDKLLSTAFVLLSISGLLGFIISSGVAIIYETNPLIRNLLILYSTIFIFSPFNTIAYYFQATLQSKRNAWAQMIGVTIVSTYKIYLILTGQGLIWMIFAFVLDYVVGAILYTINYIKSDIRFSIKNFDFNLSKTFFKSSFWLILAGATTYILLRIDQVMLKHYLHEEAVGLYSVAVRLSEVWYFIPEIIAASLFPAIINAKTIDRQLFKNRFKKLLYLLLFTAFMIAIPITIMSKYIIYFLYGIEYMSSVTILNIYVWSGLGMFIAIGINKYLIVENKLKSIFFYNILAVILNIILNMILIPKIGINGAAIATLISYSISPIIFLSIYNLKKDDRHQ